MYLTLQRHARKPVHVRIAVYTSASKTYEIWMRGSLVASGSARTSKQALAEAVRMARMALRCDRETRRAEANPFARLRALAEQQERELNALGASYLPKA